MILWSRNEKFLTERFGAICVCSEKDREELGAMDKMFVLPNGFDIPNELPVRNPGTPRKSVLWAHSNIRQTAMAHGGSLKTFGL